MKRVILIALIMAICINATPCYAVVDGITRDNYLEYEKPIRDKYGFNKGECAGPYIEGEEWFYNEGYDHWNVDLVYDRDIIPKEYLNPTVAVVEHEDKVTPKKAAKTKKVVKKSKPKKSKITYKNKCKKNR